MDMLEEVLDKYGVKPIAVLPIDTGHINQSFKVTCSRNSYFLQKINTDIFEDVGLLMNNIKVVTQHINRKSPNSTLQLVMTLNGKAYTEEQNGNCWRVYKFMEGWISRDVPQDYQEIELGGKAFGQFIRNLSDLSPSLIYSVLPDFHNSKVRLGQLSSAMSSNIANRTNQCRTEIEFLLEQQGQLNQIEVAGKNGEIPLRITHNDTKFNNVMLHLKTNKTCVVDLETAMPGYIHYDYGDGIRTICSLSKEDEMNIDEVTIDIDRCQAFTAGFLTETKGILTSKEIELLSISGPLLSYLMATRFLTDYLNGDQYYKTQYPQHNLVRARAQIRLTQLLLDKNSELTNIIQNCL